ncbi:MAG: SdrD B-like domain-containing protein [Actinomycetota bacterium]
MGRTKKTAALLTIVAMLLVALLIGTAPAMAFWWHWPREENTVEEEGDTSGGEESTEDTATTEDGSTDEGDESSGEETSAEETTTEDDGPEIQNLGKIEALIWDDTITPDGTYSIEELVDGIMVDLYTKEDDGTWTLVDRKATGPGSFTPGMEYPHGWVGWDQLPVYVGGTISYKLELVFDDTYEPIGEPTRYADLNFGNNNHVEFFPLAEKPYEPGYQIEITKPVISGYVWWDANADLTRQWAETPYAGWQVVLTNRWGRRIATTETDTNGYYQFRGLDRGTYRVWLKEKRGFKQVCPYHKWITFEPWGCYEGNYKVYAGEVKYYDHNDFGVLDMDNPRALLYYLLWQYGNAQYQFQ